MKGDTRSVDSAHTGLIFRDSPLTTTKKLVLIASPKL